MAILRWYYYFYHSAVQFRSRRWAIWKLLLSSYKNWNFFRKLKLSVHVFYMHMKIRDLAWLC